MNVFVVIGWTGLDDDEWLAEICTTMDLADDWIARQTDDTIQFRIEEWEVLGEVQETTFRNTRYSS